MKNTARVELKLILLLIITTIVAGFFNNVTIAKDPCKDISDLDDKAKCYEEQIEKKEKEYESTSKKLSDIKNQKNSVLSKISDLSSKLNVTQSEINELQSEINYMNSTLNDINKILAQKNSQLDKKIDLRNRVIRNFSKRGRLTDLELLMSSSKYANLSGFQFSSLNYMLERSLNTETIKIIDVINSEIDNYEKDKEEAENLKIELEKAQSELIALKNQVANQKTVAEKDLNELSKKEGDYEEELKDIKEKINELSEKQQSILKQKFGDSYASIGDYEQVKWTVPEPSFRPAFAVFSYGAYTHYKGMSQYGAKARADSGQNYKEIIKFYYKNDVEDHDVGDKICVQGVGEISFQKYLYGIAEMPSDWNEEALKAQAVAARSYAYRFKKAGKCICTTQSCQVYLSSKANNPPDRWKKAVDDTKNKIISGDSHAMYSSTTGGYIEGVGWDTKGGSWPKNAYEKIANSPWFYWAWYSQNYRFDSSTCGRKSPWLTDKEMADILNSWVVWNKGKSSEKDRITPVTTSCWGGNPYSIDEMADKADKYGKKYSSVKSVSVDIGNNGKTNKVTFETDKGTVTLSGDEFKTVFNLRAPGYISIRSRLYDIQKKD